MTGDDHERLGDDAEDWVTWIDNQTFMRIVPSAGGGPQHCAALAVDPADGTFLCAVYERRPQVCRDLERGSGGCAGELAGKALRPRQALVLAGRLTTPRP